MPITMNKELLIRMPFSLYSQTVKLCRKRYISISSFIRELLVEQIESSLTREEEKNVSKGGAGAVSACSGCAPGDGVSLAWRPVLSRRGRSGLLGIDKLNVG